MGRLEVVYNGVYKGLRNRDQFIPVIHPLSKFHLCIICRKSPKIFIKFKARKTFLPWQSPATIFGREDRCCGLRLTGGEREAGVNDVAKEDSLAKKEGMSNVQKVMKDKGFVNEDGIMQGEDIAKQGGLVNEDATRQS
jgi:hypothetical protein